jgi:hypothetical protein
LLQSAINKAFLDQTLAALFLPDFGMDYPMIQYADDTLIIMPACTQQVMVMKDILDKYAASTGLHINYSKSVLIPINLSNDTIVLMAQSFGCSIGQMPFIGFTFGYQTHSDGFNATGG